jgi:hypothetical protein
MYSEHVFYLVYLLLYQQLRLHVLHCLLHRWCSLEHEWRCSAL